KFGNGVREQRYVNHDKERAQRRSQRSRNESEWRGEMYQRPYDERSQIDERWANETEIGNILPYIRETRALRPGCHGFRSFTSIRLTEPPNARHQPRPKGRRLNAEVRRSMVRSGDIGNNLVRRHG